MNSPASGSELDFDFLAADALADPWKFLAPIQEQFPVFWSDAQRAWIITRHEDFTTGHRNTNLSCERLSFYRRELGEEQARRYPTAFAHLSHTISFIDPPAHTRHRAFMSKGFTRSAVDAMEITVRDIVRDALRACESTEPMDFIAEVAQKVPSRVIYTILGVPEEFRPQCDSLVHHLVLASASPAQSPQIWEGFEAATRAVMSILEHLAGEREVTHRGDMLSDWVQARENGQRLNQEELLSAMISIIVAGRDTTVNSIGVFSRIIAARQDLKAFIRRHPERMLDLVNELLRYPGLVKGMMRMVLDDFEWHGQPLKRGDYVYLMNCAANTDPRVFEKPFEIDVQRKSLKAVSFGHGIHHCIGHMLARMELSQVLAGIFQHFDMSILDDHPPMNPLFAMYGYSSLRARFSPLSS